jgi:hypothetical protein
MFSFPAAMLRSRDQLLSIPVPDRSGEVSERWQGIQHGDLAERLTVGAGKAGLNVARDSWAVSEDGAKLFGCLDLIPDQSLGIDLPSGVGLSLGIRHSNDSQFALRIIVGGRVRICSNGIFSSEFAPAVNRRHTIGVNLDQIVASGLSRFVEQARHGLAEQVDALRRVDLSHSSRVDAILLRSARNTTVAWSALGKIDDLWQNPPHEEFRTRDGWSMLNAYTEYCKGLGPLGQARVMERARDLILTAGN